MLRSLPNEHQHPTFCPLRQKLNDTNTTDTLKLGIHSAICHLREVQSIYEVLERSQNANISLANGVMINRQRQTQI